MDLRQLEYFVAVAEELHFGRAAQRTFVAQPALSRRVKGLEEELGAELLRRSSRRVRLTDEGAYLLQEARAILRRAARAAETVRSMARGESGRLRLGFVGPASQTAFPEVLREFGRTHRNIRLELLEMPTAAQLEALRGGELHAGLIRSHGHDLSGLGSLVFSREPYVLALPADLALARQEAVSVKMFDGLEFIHYPRWMQPQLYDALDRAFALAGVRPKVVQEASTKLSAIALVAAGMGAALVPESSMRALPRAGVAYLPLAEPDALPQVEFTLAWREESAAARALARMSARMAGVGKMLADAPAHGRDAHRRDGYGG